MIRLCCIVLWQFIWHSQYPSSSRQHVTMDYAYPSVYVYKIYATASRISISRWHYSCSFDGEKQLFTCLFDAAAARVLIDPIGRMYVQVSLTIKRRESRLEGTSNHSTVHTFIIAGLVLMCGWFLTANRHANWERSCFDCSCPFASASYKCKHNIWFIVAATFTEIHRECELVENMSITMWMKVCYCHDNTIPFWDEVIWLGLCISKCQ